MIYSRFFWEFSSRFALLSCQIQYSHWSLITEGSATALKAIHRTISVGWKLGVNSVTNPVECLSLRILGSVIFWNLCGKLQHCLDLSRYSGSVSIQNHNLSFLFNSPTALPKFQILFFMTELNTHQTILGFWDFKSTRICQDLLNPILTPSFPLLS